MSTIWLMIPFLYSHTEVNNQLNHYLIININNKSQVILESTTICKNVMCIGSCISLFPACRLSKWIHNCYQSPPKFDTKLQVEEVKFPRRFGSFGYLKETYNFITIDNIPWINISTHRLKKM